MSTPRSTEQIRLDMRDANDIFVDAALRLAAEQRLAADVGPLLDRVADLDSAHELMAKQFRTMQLEKEHGWREADREETRAEKAEAENQRLGEELSAAGYHEEAATVERDAALADLAHLRDQIRELAELYLYDGDTDQPFSDAYGAFHDLAAAVPSPAVTPELSTPDRMTWHRNGGSERYLDPSAREIVAWIERNGGGARYEVARFGMPSDPVEFPPVPARIAVRASTGWDYAMPGDTVVMGDEFAGPNKLATGVGPNLRSFSVERAVPVETTEDQ